MELKEFIKGTIESISNAIVESQKELTILGVIINPESSETGKGGDKFLRSDGWRYVQTIEFEISVIAEESNKKDATAKLKIFNVTDLGGGMENNLKQSNSNVIKFKLPIAFPASPTPTNYKHPPTLKAEDLIIDNNSTQ